MAATAACLWWCWRCWTSPKSNWKGAGFRVDGRGWLVIDDPAVAQQFYSAVREADLARRQDFGISWVMEGVMGRCMFTQTGTAYRRINQLFHRFYTPSASLQSAEQALPSIRQWVGDLLDRCGGGSGAAATITADDLIDLPFRLVCSHFYGTYVQKPGVMERLRFFCGEVDYLTAQVFARWEARCRHPFPTALKARLARFQASWTQFNREAMEALAAPPARAGDSLSSGNGSGGSSSVSKGSCILGAIAATGLGNVTERELMDTLCEIVLANADFVGAAVGWPVLHLLQHPTYLAAVRRADSDELLDAVIQESWRLEPMMLVTNPLLLTSAVSLAGHTFAKGTHVVFDTKALNRNAEVWDHPDDFLPQRFLHTTQPAPARAGGRPCKAVPLLQKYALHVFGLGKRRCLGKHLAKPLVRFVVKQLVTQLELQPCYKPATSGLVGPFEFPPVEFNVVGAAAAASLPFGSSSSSSHGDSGGGGGGGSISGAAMRVLVFGSAGNVGQRLVPALAADPGVNLQLAWHEKLPPLWSTAEGSAGNSNGTMHQVDLTNSAQVAACLEAAAPDRIVLVFPTLGDTDTMTRVFCDAFVAHQRQRTARGHGGVQQIVWVSDGDVDKFLETRLRGFAHLKETHQRVMALGALVPIARLESTGFFQNIELFYDLRAALASGRFESLIKANAVLPWVDAWDIADAVYRMLVTAPRHHAGRHYCLVSDFYSVNDFMAQLSARVRPIEVVELTHEQLLAKFCAQGLSKDRALDRALVFRTYHERHFPVLRADESDLQALIGRRPITMTSFVARNASRWMRLVPVAHRRRQYQF
eukprot:INCI16677.2.p1 GENE.INCI16677.2~~INCI16677.2.p1  ORF type:complete len:889 (-),score=126.33 INCI16677.2:239-2689(-)